MGHHNWSGEKSGSSWQHDKERERERERKEKKNKKSVMRVFFFLREKERANVASPLSAFGLTYLSLLF